MATGLPAQLSSLLKPQAYPHPVAAVQLVETHISWVLLTGELAYKIKRPVHYSFVDLRSPERRAFFCAEELRLNRRFAPELYVDVCEIAASHGEARIAGQGEVIEHAVRMRQFERENELDRLLASARIAPPELDRFGRDLAAIHEQLPVAQESQTWGRAADVRALLLENFDQCLEVAAPLGTQAELRALRQQYAARLDALEPWLAARRQAGRVRECHGDLHARNIVRYGGRLIAFDCVEFAPAFRWIDVADEIAFLLMDLDARRCPLHAQAFRGGYLAHSGDFQACRVLGLYEIHRALVRAKVTALEAAQASRGTARDTALEQHRVYLDCARRQLAPQRPRLLLMCGLSGSGKTWMAERLAPLLGAVHVRSDVERKRLAGLAERERSHSAVEQGLYAREVSAHVYERLAQCADDALAGGYTVIVDATLQRRADRLRFRELAAQRGAQLRLIHCSAAHDVLRARIALRAGSGTDASEADPSVLQWQETHFEPVGAEEGIAVIDADTTRAEIVAEVLARITAAGS